MAAKKPETVFDIETLFSDINRSFLTAAQTHLSVTPVTLAGTRSLLRDQSWLPRRSPLAIWVSPPAVPGDTSWTGAVGLRDIAREAILSHLEEPDLAVSG